jgi:DNA-binding LacI/PurR family transcriptional regulator
LVTRSDVAKYAGVSNTTVSRVVNNSGYVSPESRERVEEAIKTLGYTPNLVARSLKTKKSGQLLFCVSDFSNPFYIEIYTGMEELARQHGYTIVVASDFSSKMVAQRQFDGIIFSQLSKEKEADLSSMDIPVVINNYTTENYSLPFIKIDIKNGAEKAMKYLYDNGHRHIAYITNVPSEEEQRYSAYLDFVKNKKLPVNDDYIVSCTGFTTPYEQGYNAALELINRNLILSAILAFNDAMAIGILAALSESGIKVPQGISIISFDDLQQSKFTTPSLSTVKIPKYELGAESINMLLKKIHGGVINSTTIGTELIIRGSVLTINSP